MHDAARLVPDLRVADIACRHQVVQRPARDTGDLLGLGQREVSFLDKWRTRGPFSGRTVLLGGHAEFQLIGRGIWALKSAAQTRRGEPSCRTGSVSHRSRMRKMPNLRITHPTLTQRNGQVIFIQSVHSRRRAGDRAVPDVVALVA